MPTGTASPAKAAEKTDDAKTDEGTPAATGGEVGTGTGKTSPEERIFTQDELSAIVAREVAKAKDPEQARKAAEYDRIQREQQTEAERSEQARKEAEEKAARAIATANERLMRAELRLQLAAQGARADAIDLSVDRLLTTEGLEVTDAGEVKGAEAAVKALLGKHDYLKAPTKESLPDRSGGEYKGGTPATVDDQIAEAEAKGDYKAARRLKLRRYEAGLSK